MGIIRVVKTNQFSVISNAVLQDERLSYSAIGIAARLLSLPDSWHIREDYLVDHSPSGRGDVRRAMSELQAYGYLHRRRYQTRPGGPMRHDVALYEQPHACNCDNPACRNWHAAPTCEAPTAGFPTVGIPTVGEPAVIDSTYDQKLKEIDLDHDLDPSFSLKERATASTATASDSTPPTIVTELTNEQPTATGSTQQAEIDACLLAYYDNGGRPLSADTTAQFTTLVRTYTGAALLRAVSNAAAQVDPTKEKPANKVNVNYLGGMLRRMEAEGKLDPENQATPPAAPATRDTRHRKTYADSTAEERRRKYAVPEAYSYADQAPAAPEPPDDGDANRAEVHAIAAKLVGEHRYWGSHRAAVEGAIDVHGCAAVRDQLELAKVTTPAGQRADLRRLLATVTA